MSATEELRRLLDERGVEYEGGERSLRWRDRYGIMMQAFPLANGELGMGVWSCTPEQAIAATLGSGNCSNDCTNSERTGECHNASEYPRMFFCCSECGCAHKRNRAYVDMPRFCPNCGRRIVEPTTNDVDVEVAE